MARVLVIIPAYNESDTIGSVLAGLREHVPDCDVLVVDDGSTDGTANVVRRFPGVTLIRLPYNLGIGGAMQTGYRYAAHHGYAVAVQCDADGQHPVHQISKLLARVEDGTADLIIGSRYVANTDYRPSLGRRIGKSLLSRLVDSVVGGGITDTTSGFRAMNRRAIEVFARSYPDDYPEAEALVILHKHGLRCAEVPVDMRPRQGGVTSISPRRAAYYLIKVSLAILIDMMKRPRPAGGVHGGLAPAPADVSDGRRRAGHG